MIFAAMVLMLSTEINLDLTPLVRAAAKARPAACGIRVVGYRISGTPGQTFVYAGETFEIPAEGAIELIADPRRKSCWFEGREIALSGPLNAFGFMEVRLDGRKGEER